MIRAEIERYIKHYEKLERNDFQNGELYICQELLSFLDTFSEEPDKSLEDAAKHYAYIDWSSDEDIYAFEIKKYDAFKAGAEWQKEQMLKEAVECELVCIKDRLAAILPMKEFRWTVGDKVRIVVLKAEEK